jgi:hypothetical protein
MANKEKVLFYFIEDNILIFFDSLSPLKRLSNGNDSIGKAWNKLCWIETIGFQ